MTQVKSFSIKALLLSLLLLPALFLFSACGASQLNTKASINTSGNYVPTDETNDFTEFLADEGTVASFAKGMHLTMEMEMENDGVTSRIYMNAYVKYKIDEDEGTVSISEMSLRVEMLMGEESYKADMYFRDGYLYTDALGEKFKHETTAEALETFLIGMPGGWIDVDVMLDMIGDADLFDVEIATVGPNTKYKLTLKEDVPEGELLNLEGVTIYIIFNNGQLTGICMESDEGENKVTMVGFDGKINFPDLTQFIDDMP